ncbi:MAG: FHA domain-containing protein [Propionibacteriaceae bacterium]|jgi:pSer/pThr/pTyr-binding forkhead associated (FHA) protein|nr:FHA domain-containing protein [Propionibacteriaceae bacterium]
MNGQPSPGDNPFSQLWGLTAYRTIEDAAVRDIRDDDTAPAPTPSESSPPAAPPPRLAILELPDGRRLDVTGLTVLGRAAAEHGQPSEPDGQFVTLASPDKLISRRHLRLAPADGWMTAEDLGSANGTRLRRRGQPPASLAPGQPVALRSGDQLELSETVVIGLFAVPEDDS